MDVDLLKSDNRPNAGYSGSISCTRILQKPVLSFKPSTISPSMDLGSVCKSNNADDYPDDDGRSSTETGVLTKPESKTQKPNLYKVLLLNDDYTPMEFVIHVLQRFFRMTVSEATEVMLHVHQKGVGICGVFTYEIAETKVNQVLQFAQQHEHPLQCTLEKE